MTASAVLSESGGTFRSKSLTQIAFGFSLATLFLGENVPGNLMEFVLSGSFARFITSGTLLGAFLVLVDPVDRLLGKHVPTHRHNPLTKDVRTGESWAENLLPQMKKIHLSREGAREFSPDLLKDTRKRSYDSPYVTGMRSKIIAQTYLFIILLAFFPLEVITGELLGGWPRLLVQALLLVGALFVIAALWWDMGKLRDRMSVIAIHEMIVLLNIGTTEYDLVRALMKRGYWSEAKSWIDRGLAGWLVAVER